MIHWREHYSSADKKKPKTKPIHTTTSGFQFTYNRRVILLTCFQKAIKVTETFNLPCSPQLSKQTTLFTTNTNKIFKVFLMY